MTGGAHSQLLTGGRLHLHHGPIDVVLKAFGTEQAVSAAHEAARRRFDTILGELASELANLRRPVTERHEFTSTVARRMAEACRHFAPVFVTPMAAVAGAVADELMAAMLAAAPLARAYVNDGGDVAVHVAPGERLRIGIAGDFADRRIAALNGAIQIRHGDGIGGIATSGARGRSLSLGIADSVTVLASSAAIADATATLIANAVDVASPAVTRVPAFDLDPDSDLGDRLVTTEVGALSRHEIEVALARGRTVGELYAASNLIKAAALMLKGEIVVAGPTPFLLEEERT